MNNRIILSLFLVVTIFVNCFAQNVVTTTFPYGNQIKDGTQAAMARLYKVELIEHSTYVTIELTPTKNLKRLKYWTSLHTYVESGNARLPIVGTFINNAIRPCTYEDGWGWDNAKKDQHYYYTLVFCGRIPEGRTSFSLKDYAEYGRGFSFSGYTINNPISNPKRDEAYCRANADKNNDGICGIYEEIGGNNYRLGCIKEDGKYYIIYLSGGISNTWWFTGEKKAYLEASASVGTYKANWIMLDKTIQSAFVTFDGSVMKSILPDGMPKESSYVKMYPTSSSGSGISGGGSIGSSEWTGSGFALLNNYMVTNYHVIENAKKITVQGVNGDFNKKYEATVIASDKYNDLAILQIKGSTVSNTNIPYSIKTSTSEVGEDIFVLGYPLTSTMGDEIKLTTGVISSKTGFQGDVSLYQISAPIQPGNSGGPLFDSNGNVIGIVSAKHRGAENVGYAIKASYLRSLMESAMSTNILPQNNKISTQNLTGKVKSVKNYVYYVTCSSN